jgi:hypothetical protein
MFEDVRGKYKLKAVFRKRQGLQQVEISYVSKNTSPVLLKPFDRHFPCMVKDQRHEWHLADPDVRGDIRIYPTAYRAVEASDMKLVVHLQQLE